MGKKAPDRHSDELKWLHRQNIARYKSMLANASQHRDHDQIKKLMRDEEDKLRALDHQ